MQVQTLPGLFLLLIVILAGATPCLAQQGPGILPDSSGTLLPPPDSTNSNQDTLTLKSQLDETISYSARDSIFFTIDKKKGYLYGNAVVIKGEDKLTAAYIMIDLEKSELYAEARYDSATGEYEGIPVLNYLGEELSALSLSYNFKTRKGTSSAAETALEEGFFYAKKVKRVTDNVIYGEDGVFTTCDAPHPHFYFSAPKMKMVTGDRIFADQVALYVADVPIFYIPFGIYFPNNSGKHSGLIIPRWGQNTQQGFSLYGLGYFWDINDYVDTKFTSDLYSKGGYTLRNDTRFRLRGVIERSDLGLTYGQTRTDPDNPLTTNFILSYYHQQKIGRRSSLGGNLNFSSKEALRNTTTNTDRFDRLNDNTTQLITSNFSYSTSWAWGGALSINYARTQNIITDELLNETLPEISFTLPTITPFASPSGSSGILDNLAIGYGVRATRQSVRRDTLPGGGFGTVDTKQAIVHSPTISISPKLGYFTLQPSFSYNESWFFRRIVKQPNGAEIDTTFIDGFYRASSWNAGARLSTTLYGIVQPEILGLNAIRHRLVPSIGVSYSPDFSDPSYGYYDQFFNPVTNSVTQYSIFEADAGVGRIPGSGRQELITYSLDNTFEAKIAQGDTLQDKRLQLLQLTISGNYNMAAPNNFRWSPISTTASTNLGAFGTLSGSATFDPYDVDTLGRRIPDLLWKKDGTLARVTNARISFSTSFSDQGFNDDPYSQSIADSAIARRQRFNFDHVEFNEDEFFGEHIRGADKFRIPWQVGLRGSYNITPNAITGDVTTEFDISTNFSFSLTPTTRISSSASYDIKEGRIDIPSINVTKDLHCWEMQFNWYPSGYNPGFYFRIGLKAPQLRDLKLEREG